jgi:geranylgeranyl diphosphate synthase type II
LLRSKDISREKKVKAVTEVYNSLQIKEIVQKKIQELNKKALDYLNKVSVLEDKKSELKKLASKLITRDN